MEYNLDTMHKSTLVTAMKESPILYANITRSRTQRSSLSQPSASPAEIGPGAYTFPAARDVRVSLVLNQNPLSRCAPTCATAQTRHHVHAQELSFRARFRVLYACATRYRATVARP